MNPPDQTDLPAGLPVHEIVHLTSIRALDPDLQDDVRRFTQACIRLQQLRRTNPTSNVIKFRRNP